MNTTMIADNINNLGITADNVVNAMTNAVGIDTEPIDTDNINNAEIEIDKSEDIVMSDDNDDNPAMSNKDSPHATLGDDNAENSEPGENSTEDEPSPLIYGREMTNPTKVKTSKGADLLGLHSWNLPQVIHMRIKIPQVKRKVIHSILPMCEHRNSLFKAHQTLKI